MGAGPQLGVETKRVKGKLKGHMATSQAGPEGVRVQSSIDPYGGMNKRRWLFVLACLAIGILLVPVDSTVQPYFAQLGRNGFVDAVEDVWKELAATSGILLFVLAGAWSLRKDRGRALAVFAVCVAASSAAGQGVKYLIGRARPDSVSDQTLFYGPFSGVHPARGVQIDSMPSGHTTAAFAMAVALAWRWPRLAPLWYSLAAGVGVSRVLADAHFPSDVVLGACLGSAVGWVICARASAIGRGPLGAGLQGEPVGLAEAEEERHAREEEAAG